MTLRVFISYATKNNMRRHVSRFRDDLQQELEQTIIDEDVDVFLAVHNLQTGADWKEEIERYLNKCDVFLPMCTENYFVSDPCSQEWGLFRKRLLSSVPFGQTVPSRIIPIWWRALGYFPPIIKNYHLGLDGMPVTTREGLYDHLLDSQSYGRYMKSLRNLARRIKKVRDDNEPAGWRDHDFGLRMRAQDRAFDVERFRKSATHCNVVHAIATPDHLQGLSSHRLSGLAEENYRDDVKEWDPLGVRQNHGGAGISNWAAMNGYPVLILDWALQKLNIIQDDEPLSPFLAWPPKQATMIERKQTPTIALFDPADPIRARSWMADRVGASPPEKRLVLVPLAAGERQPTDGSPGEQAVAQPQDAGGAASAASVTPEPPVDIGLPLVASCVGGTDDVVETIRRKIAVTADVDLAMARATAPVPNPSRFRRRTA